MKCGHKLILGALVAAGLSLTCGAATYTDATGDHKWGTAGNWDPEGVPAAGAEVTIPKGLTVVVDDADYSAANAVSKIILAYGATNVMTSAKPYTTPALSSYGTLVKDTAAPWVLTKTQNIFYGSLVINQGVVTNTVTSGCFAPWTDLNLKNIGLFVKEGAMLVSTVSETFGCHWVSLAGTGINGEGALVITVKNSNNYIARLKLEADAKIVRASTLWFTCSSNDTDTNIELNGHTLTIDSIGGTYLSIYANTGYLKGPGTFHVKNTYLFTYVNYSYCANKMNGMGSPWRLEDPTATIKLGNGVEFATQDEVPAAHARLEVEENATAAFYHMHTRDGVTCRPSVLTNCWAGEIYLNAGATLRTGVRRKKGSEEGIWFAGSISGPGTFAPYVTSPRGYYLVGHVNCDWATNELSAAHAPASFFNAGDISVGRTNALPRPENLTIGAGVLAAACANQEVEDAWTPAALAHYSDVVHWGDYGYWAINARGCPNDTYTLAAADVNGKVTGEALALGANGGTVELTGTFEKPVRAIAYAGELKLTGDCEIKLAAGSVATSYGTNAPSVFTLDGAKHVMQPHDGFYIGMPWKNSSNAWPWDLAPVGRMVVRNSLFTPEEIPAGDVYTNLHDRALKVGWNRRGVLEIEEGAVITNRLLVGSGWDAGYKSANAMHHGNGAGCVIQRGGELAMLGNGYWATTYEASVFGGGFSSYGYLELTGGKTVVLGQLAFGGNGIALLTVNGGSLTYENALSQWGMSNKVPPAWFQCANEGRVNVYVKKGSIVRKGETYVLIGGNSGTRADITVDGPEAVIDWRTLRTGPSSPNRDARAVYNLRNGGLFRSDVIRPYYGSTRGVTNLVTVNFDGGIYKPSSSGTIFGGPSVATATNFPFTVVRVYPGGATIDSAGCAVTSLSAIEKPFGQGVASVEWNDNREHYGPPFVKVIGDGEGASVVAEYDSVARRVTGIKVLSPGCGYTWAKVVVRDGLNGCIDSTNLCTLAANETTGSFTKAGTGTLTLSAVNTWGGDTILKGGTLKCGVDGAIPADTTFVLAGGLLDMNGKTLSDGVTTWPTKWAVDAANGAVEYPGDFTFAPGATLEIKGQDALTAGDRTATLLTITGTKTGLPTLGTLEDAHFTLVWSGNSLKAKRLKGTVLLVR